MAYTRKNPFYFKGHLNPQASYPIFVWRNAILAELIQDIEQKEFPILIGPRQSGKTTIAYQLWQRLLQNTANKNLVFYLECGNLASSSGTDVLSDIHKTCLKTLKLNYSDMEQQFSDIFSSKTPSSMYELSEFLDSLYLKSHGIDRIVLIIDEIKVLSDDLIHDLLCTFRYLYESHHTKPDHLTNFSVIILCQQDLSIFDIGRGSPYNIATVRRLGNFSYNEYSALLDNDHAGKFISITFDDTAKEYIFANTNGQPYLSQKICYIALEIAWNNNLEEIDKRTAMMALFSLFKDGDRNLLIIEKAVKADKYMEMLVVDLLRGWRKPFQRTNECIRYSEEKGVIIENPANGMCVFRTKLYKRLLLNLYFNRIHTITGKYLLYDLTLFTDISEVQGLLLNEDIVKTISDKFKNLDDIDLTKLSEFIQEQDINIDIEEIQFSFEFWKQDLDIRRLNSRVIYKILSTLFIEILKIKE